MEVKKGSYAVLAGMIWDQTPFISEEDMTGILSPLDTQEQVNNFKYFLETTDISKVTRHQLYMKANEM